MTPPTPPRAPRKLRWKLLLLLPYLCLLFPALYARATPKLFGFPLFPWHQFGWVVLASLSMGLLYRHLRD